MCIDFKKILKVGGYEMHFENMLVWLPNYKNDNWQASLSTISAGKIDFIILDKDEDGTWCKDHDGSCTSDNDCGPMWVCNKGRCMPGCK